MAFSSFGMTLVLILLVVVTFFVLIFLLTLILSSRKKSPMPSVPQSVLSFIKTGLSKGYSKEQLRGALVGKGWNESVVDDALREVGRKN